MPDFKVRRKILGMNGMDISSGTACMPAADIGGTSNFTQFSSTGRLTMAGTARVKKDQWVEPESFLVAATSGSWASGSMEVDITGSVFAGVAGSMVSVYYVGPAAKVSGSPTTGFAKINKPADADTSGSIDVWLEWSTAETPVGTACVTVWKAGLAYFGSGSTVRTAASCGACPVYASESANVWYSSSLGQLPSWTANDTWGVLVIQHDLADGAEKLGGSSAKLSGVRLRYTACALGVASAE